MLRVKAGTTRWSASVIRLISLGCVAVPVLVLIYDAQTIIENLDFSAVTHTVSEFALRNFGLLEKASMVLASFLLTSMAFVWKLRLAPAFGKLFAMGSYLLFITGLCFIVVAIFPTDGRNAARTTLGIAHIVSATSASAIFPAFLVLTFLGLKTNPRFYGLARFSLFIAVCGVLSLVWMLLAYVVTDTPGLAERTMMLLYLLWLATAGYRLTSYAAEQ